MATVYLATVTGPGGFETVHAVKRIHPHLAKQDAFVEMFLDEARIASRIHHPNVCEVLDFGESNGTYYLAMEYLLGEPFSQVMETLHRNAVERDSPRWPVFVCRVIGEACEGLHAAHELTGPDGASLEVVHRDVSPQNIFLTFDGTVKIVDFGIARATGRIHRTSAGQVKGKFSYMPPEQSRGAAVDRRADVWALGVVLWEALTLRRLFRRETTTDTLKAMLTEEIRPPSVFRASVDERLDEIVLKALSRIPEERYPTARALGRDLSRYAGSTGEPADAAELSDWMHVLFPEGRQRVFDVTNVVRRGELDETMVTVNVEDSDSEVETVETGLPPPRVAGLEITAPGEVVDVQHAPPEAPPEGRPSRPVFIGAGVVLVLLLLGLGGAVIWAAMMDESADVAAPPGASAPDSRDPLEHP